MTHKDIYEKFMIEYDKANITSSYPSLTEYEVATILDKAYLALIAQKITGNNQRKAGFEFDVKAIEDLRPLITCKTLDKQSTDYSYSSNDYVYRVPDDLLYYVTSKFLRFKKQGTSIDDKPHSIETVKLVDHNIADKYMATDSNLPWISSPMTFMENKYNHVLVDSYKVKDDYDNKLKLTYICKFEKFVDNLKEYKFSDTEFKLSDSMAEELINLAIVFATNTVESTKLLQLISLLNLES